MDQGSYNNLGCDQKHLSPIAAVCLACRQLPWFPIIIGLIISGLVLFGFIATERAHMQIKAKLSAQATASGEATAAHVGQILDEAHGTLRSLARLIHLRQFPQPESDEVLVAVAEQINSDRPETAALALIDSSGQALLLDRKFSGQRFDVSARPYFPIAQRSAINSFSYGPPTRNMNTSSVNVPVMLKIEHQGNELILASAFVESQMQDYLERLVPGVDGISALVQRVNEFGPAQVISLAGPLEQFSEGRLAEFLVSRTWAGSDGQVYELVATNVAQSPFTIVTGYSNRGVNTLFGQELRSQTLLIICAVLILCLGSCVLLVFVGRNIHATRQLGRSEQHFRDLVEGSLQGIWIHRDFRPLFVNEAALEMLGLESEEEFLALPSTELFVADYDQLRLWEYNAARVRGDPVPATYEFTAIRKDGSERVLLNAVRIIEWNGLPAVQCTAIDITEANDLTERLAYEASHDELTGLLNRRAFLESLRRSFLIKAARARVHVLFILDLDQFKVVNDTCGHAAGDDLLRQFSEMLGSHVRDQDTLARLGGDEFAVLLHDFPREQVEKVAQTFLEMTEKYCFQWDENHFKIGVSIGIAPIQDNVSDITQLMTMADNACYAAKELGRNRFHVFDDSDQTIVQRSGDMRWIARFEKALTANDFYLVAQPLADLHEQVSGSHFELLLRMKTDEGGIISPGIFMPSAERYHMATRIDRWVLDTALGWLGSSSSMLDELYLCNLNISGQTVADKEQRDYFVRAISESAVPPTKLCFEITETAAMVNVMTALEFMRDLRALGCLFALDDFGSGLSSFGYLKSLPVDFVKIDGQFVKTISQDPANLAILRSIHQVAMATGKMTVAEFVEDERTLELLREIGIDFAQGYHIGRPEIIDLEAGIKQSVQIYANSAANR